MISGDEREDNRRSIYWVGVEEVDSCECRRFSEGLQMFNRRKMWKCVFKKKEVNKISFEFERFRKVNISLSQRTVIS